ncbi:MAG: MptD family putative ECF transporter S component [Syntrophomonadaceae bacterium]|nr:MptD family putative ECF transporter S component [Syntrophomonadaceae bacterium]
MQATASRELRGKDLITIGIFSAIYLVINLIFHVMGGIHPIMWLMMPGLIAVFASVPYLLMASKVQKPFAVLIMGLITGLIYFATGMFTVVILITYAAASVLAETVRFITKYKSFIGNAASFVFYSLGIIGSFLPLWLFKDSFFAQISQHGVSAEYLSVLSKLVTDGMLMVIILVTMVLAIVGTLIARALFGKHFIKAGIV